MRRLFKRTVSFLLMSALLMASAACGSGGSIHTDIVSYKAALTAQEISAFPDAFVTGMNRYGWTAAAALYDGENLSVSPASLELALLMTRTGAINETADQMKTALFMSALSDEEILAACKQLMWRANTNGMETANSVWTQKNYPFHSDFISICRDNFMADAFSVDFMKDSDGATDAVNAWASEKTHGKIAEMNPSPLPADTRLVLINALYFLGDWEIPFVAGNTSESVFHGSSNSVTVKFMHDMRKMSYSETPLYQMISLPFKGEEGKADSPYSMAFILPAEGQDVRSVMESLAVEGFSEACGSLTDTSVRLSLPKFAFTYDTSMKDTMKSLGMDLAFEDGAQFDGMTGGPNDLFISDILHKCYIRVDEEGAEAAAVTEVIVAETAIQEPEDYKTFNADRPFLFAIYDETDNTVLFLGAVGQL